MVARASQQPLKSIRKIMKTDIILAGVGGQGILSIATILGRPHLPTTYI